MGWHCESALPVEQTRIESDTRPRCALIHRHRPELIDWDKLDKVGRESGRSKLADLST